MSEKVKKEKIDYPFMLPLVLGTMMNPLNSTMLATSLVALCGAYKVTAGEGAILITSLYITSAVAQPLMGRLADIFSAKKINTLGFLLALAAALIGVFAPAFGWLVVSRVLLGLGTSAAYPSAMALINKKYEAEQRPVPGPVLGMVVLSSQLSMILGPVLGGLLTEVMGWKGVFFINIPWVLIALYLSRAIPDFPAPANNKKESLIRRLDLVGIALFTAFLLSLLFLLTHRDFSWEWISAVSGLLLMLILWERRQDNPFIDVRLFVSNPVLSLVYLRTLAVTYMLYMILYSLPQWIEAVKHVSPGRTGLMMIPNSVMSIIFGLLISKFRSLFHQNLLGVIVMAAACTGLYFLHQEVSVYFILVVILVNGIGEGVNMVANQALLNKEAPANQKGVSFGLGRTFGYLGAIISSSQLKVLFHNGIDDHSFHQINNYIIYSVIVLALLLIPVWRMGRKEAM